MTTIQLLFDDGKNQLSRLLSFKAGAQLFLLALRSAPAGPRAARPGSQADPISLSRRSGLQPETSSVLALDLQTGSTFP